MRLCRCKYQTAPEGSAIAAPAPVSTPPAVLATPLTLLQLLAPPDPRCPARRSVAWTVRGRRDARGDALGLRVSKWPASCSAAIVQKVLIEVCGLSRYLGAGQTERLDSFGRTAWHGLQKQETHHPQVNTGASLRSAP